MGWVYLIFFQLLWAADPSCPDLLAQSDLVGSRKSFADLLKANDILAIPGGVKLSSVELGVSIELTKVGVEVFQAKITIPPAAAGGGDTGGSGGSSGGGPGSSGGGGSEESQNKENRGPCVSRNVILFTVSSAANLVGAYSAYTKVDYDHNLPWYKASLQWGFDKTRAGFASPSDYWTAFKNDSQFVHNNGLNAIMMGTLSYVECALGPAKAAAVTTTVALLSSVASQLFSSGELSFSRTVLDVAFVRYLSIPRVRLGAYFDKNVFQKHATRYLEVSSYYLVDQYLGGFGYGILQNLNESHWPAHLNFQIGVNDFGFSKDRILDSDANLNARPIPNR